VNDYGIWRINRFGDFAAGDKTLVEKREQADRDAERLRTDCDFQFSAGLAYPFELGPAFGADFKIRASSYVGAGVRLYTAGEDFFQLEATSGIFIPIRIKKIGLTPYGEVGFGFIKAGSFTKAAKNPYDVDKLNLGFAVSFQGGLQFTTSVVPGLYLQAAYQYNLYLLALALPGDPSVLFFSIGYGF
jgi:hypothetical protein